MMVRYEEEPKAPHLIDNMNTGTQQRERSESRHCAPFLVTISHRQLEQQQSERVKRHDDDKSKFDREKERHQKRNEVSEQQIEAELSLSTDWRE
jgi:hypothetical protein